MSFFFIFDFLSTLGNGKFCAFLFRKELGLGDFSIHETSIPVLQNTFEAASFSSRCFCKSVSIERGSDRLLFMTVECKMAWASFPSYGKS